MDMDIVRVEECVSFGNRGGNGQVYLWTHS